MPGRQPSTDAAHAGYGETALPLDELTALTPGPREILEAHHQSGGVDQRDSEFTSMRKELRASANDRVPRRV